MKIYSVFDKEFKEYGKVIEGFDVKDMTSELKNFKVGDGVDYVASNSNLERLALKNELEDNTFGGLEIQIGCCYGKNTKLNCLEYHRSSELNLSCDDFILLLAKESEIEDYKLDTKKVKAFHCPANTLINVFATTLHYAPCSFKNGEAFRVMVVLPKGTNEAYLPKEIKSEEDKFLFAKNKWLLAHKDSSEAKNGGVVALVGENIDIKNSI